MLNKNKDKMMGTWRGGEQEHNDKKQHEGIVALNGDHMHTTTMIISKGMKELTTYMKSYIKHMDNNKMTKEVKQSGDEEQ